MGKRIKMRELIYNVVYRLFRGKLITLDIETNDCVATLRMDNGDMATISRDAYQDFCLGYAYCRNGEERLKEYLKNARNGYFSDSGDIILIHKINRIELKITPKTINVKYYK